MLGGVISLIVGGLRGLLKLVVSLGRDRSGSVVSILSLKSITIDSEWVEGSLGLRSGEQGEGRAVDDDDEVVVVVAWGSKG